MRPLTLWRLALVGIALSGSVGLALLLWAAVGLLTRSRFA